MTKYEFGIVTNAAEISAVAVLADMLADPDFSGPFYITCVSILRGQSS